MTDGLTDPNYRKASLLKIIEIKKVFTNIFYCKKLVILHKHSIMNIPLDLHFQVKFIFDFIRKPLTKFILK